jgi:nucleotide-binding universal stress UspA family protein
LHANDGSEPAFKALQTALHTARRYQAPLHMVCVEELPRFATTIDEVVEEQEEADHRFHDVIERAQRLARMQRVKLHPRVVIGHPVPRIVEIVKQDGFELLVIGFMGHSAIYDRIIGSTTDRLVRLAPCAVLVVK